MENSVQRWFGRTVLPRFHHGLWSKTCAPSNSLRDKESRLYFSTNSPCAPSNSLLDKESRLLYFSTNSPWNRQQSPLWSQTPWLSQRRSRMFSSLQTPFYSSLTLSKRSGDGVFGTISTRSVTNKATAEDSEAYRSALPFESVPTVGGLCAIPYIGMRFLFKPFSKYDVEGIGHVIHELHDTHGPIFRMKMGKHWVVITENVDDADIVLRSEMEFPYRPPISIIEVYNKRAERPIATLGMLNGPAWKRLRSPMNVRMNRPKSAAHYLSCQEEVAVDFAHRLYHLQDSPPEVLVDFFFRFATESVGVVCYNKRLGFLAEDFELDSRKQKLLASYVTVVRSISQAIYMKRFLFRLYEDSFYKTFKEAFETTFEYTKERVQEAAEEIARREREGTLDPDEPNLLLSLMTEKNLSEDDMMDIISALMTAGSESIACTLQLLFYALATNKDKQEKLAEELLTHMGPDGHLTASVLDKLVYLKATVRESSRLYYPVPMGPERRLTSDAVLSGYHIPKGATVRISSFHIALSENFYDHPNSFVPERWLRDQGGQRQRNIPTLAYLPFGYGTRNCIARRFALQELYLATTKVLQHYRIGLKDNRPQLETIFTPFRSPRHPMPFTFTSRS